MKRLRRIIFNSLTVLSLVLCVGTVMLWVRSYSSRDIVSFGRAGGNCHLVQSLLGRVHLLSNLDGGCSGGTSYTSDLCSRQAIWNGGMSGYPPRPQWHLGCIWQTYQRSRFMFSQANPVVVTRHRLIVLPYWMLSAAFAIMPMAWLARRRWGHRRPGHCRVCGYDLRATPERCPECGKKK